MHDAAPDTQAALAGRSRASRIFNVVVGSIGAAALAYMLHDLGWSRAFGVFVDVGAWLVIVIGLDVIGLGFDAAAIQSFMASGGRRVAYPRVLAAQWSGRAINVLTPGGALGEATKVTLLQGYASPGRILSSIVLFNLAAFYLSIAVVLVGVPLTLVLVELPHALSVIIWIGIGVLIPLVVLLGIAVHRGLARSLIGVIRATRLISKERMARWTTRLQDLDQHLQELHQRRSHETRRGFTFLVSARLMTWIATGTLLHAVGVALSPTLMVGVLSVGVLINWISAIVPLGLGVADGSNYGLYAVLGAGGANGLLVTLVNRARSLCIAILGLGVMAIAYGYDSITEVRRRVRQRAAIKAPAASEAT